MSKTRTVTARALIVLKVRLNGASTDDLVNKMQLELAESKLLSCSGIVGRRLEVFESSVETTIDGEDD